MIELTFDDGEVFVTPEDYDYFLLSARTSLCFISRPGA
jgi:hypothetical protein